MSDPPPAYYYNSTGGAEKSPLLAMPPGQPAPATTTVIYQEAPSSSGRKCCGVSLAVCLFLCVCCFCIVVILGAIFGAWAARCSSIEEYRVEHHTGVFSGPQADIELQCNGNILIKGNPLLTTSIETTTTISAPDNATANEIRFDFTSTPTEFSLEFGWNFWNCPKENIDAQLRDFANTGIPYSLEATSISGTIDVQSLTLLSFEEVELVAYSGAVSAQGLKAADDIKIFAANGKVTLETSTAKELELTTSNAAVALNGVFAGAYDVVTTNDAITGSLVEVTTLGDKCEVLFRTTNGEIVINGLDLPTTVTCVIDIETTNGPVTLYVRDFYGQYQFKTTNGQVTVDGNSCDTRCTGNVPGPVSHTLYIETTNANIDVEWL